MLHPILQAPSLTVGDLPEAPVFCVGFVPFNGRDS